jgi:hypothetical protein
MPMSDAPRLRTPRDWAINLAAMTVLGAFLGVIGPFGTFNGGPLGIRLAYWIASMWIGFTIISTVVRLSMRLAARWDLPVWFTLAVGAAIGSALLATVVDGAQDYVFNGHPRGKGSWLEQYGYVLALTEPFAFLYFFVVGRGWRGAAPAVPVFPSPAVSSASGAGGDSFLNRLPPRLGRELLCLQMEDHYVRAHTARGSDLILIPLKEAMAELDGLSGLQVHRSWWVARDAVAEAVTSGRNLTLRLTNGLDAPVSRASIAKLKAAGWLEPRSGF